jgi:hypothetical protein
MKKKQTRITLAAVALALTCASSAAQELPRTGLRGADLDAGLRARGIILTTTPDQPVVLFDQNDTLDGATVSAAIGSTILLQRGGHPCQYSLDFDKPKDSVSFNRSHLRAGPTGVSHPVWTATAYDNNGRVLSTVGEREIRSGTDVPAQHFTLAGPGIVRIVLRGDDKGFDNYCNVVVDTMDVMQ